MTEALSLIAVIWGVTGIFFVLRSPSRGVVADILFGVLWPVYCYTDWRSGAWVPTIRGTLFLLFPAIVAVCVALLAKV